ncbi:alpha/beta fold hydrolase [Amycolatopsis sp. A133]|uniref:alpha/beta hydrolase n=1 Tax=Amycolatopsis sp. A133 TaxID=3064472 RepID=UPI0027F63385|nr:alpha/beta fold hydrolase [Amycolatopsis sp. A133]MDQ7809081.1 alpha/beta fold hydrolase [Amycolatopsis sp. A133]
MTSSPPNRRTILGSALLAGFEPPPGHGTAAETDFVLAHGAWHSGAVWAEVSFELTAAGARVCALDLPGAGPNARFPVSYLTTGQQGLTTKASPLRDLTLDDTADVVVAALRRLRGAGRKLVLVAHSLGGLTVTRAVKQAPGLVDHLVYVAALVPTLLGSAAAYLRLPEAGPRYPDLYIGDPAAIGATRINFRSTTPATARCCTAPSTATSTKSGSWPSPTVWSRTTPPGSPRPRSARPGNGGDRYRARTC